MVETVLWRRLCYGGGCVVLVVEAVYGGGSVMVEAML